jgi:hypothetical protein
MNRVSSGAVFGTNFNDKDAVIRLASSFGPGQTVFKHPDRVGFNITHTERTDRYEPEWVVHQT